MAPLRPPAPAAGTPRALLAVAILGRRLAVGFLVVLAVAVVGGRLLVGGKLFLAGRRLDLRLDLVAEVDLGAVLLLVLELVAAAKLAQLAGRDLELVGNPRIGAPLADPGADLVEL